MLCGGGGGGGDVGAVVAAVKKTEAVVKLYASVCNVTI